MKKLTIVFLALVILLSFCACSSYQSSYSAAMLVRSEGGDHCEARFGSLKGTLVLKTRVRDRDADGMIHYEAELGEGELSVYYDVNGTKELLFSLKGGERLDSRGGKVAVGDKVTIIIETVETVKNGEIEIDFD